MLRIERILVPVDFSSHADRALDYAIGLAGLVKAKELLLLHVVEPLSMAAPVAGGVPAPGYAGLLQEMRESAERELESRAERVREASIPVRTVVLDGRPAEAIAVEAERESVDLVVMGTRGRTGLAHVLFGSVAERTVGRAACPVLAVPVGEDAGDSA